MLVGIETYPSVVDHHSALLHFLDAGILAFFVAEIAVKLIAHGARPWRYFQDPWNVFDFLIVAGAFMPVAASYATVLRLLRLLRVLRLVRALPKLQMLVGALLNSIPSMIYVSLLLGLLFYVYAVAGVFLWRANDPHHFGNLQTAFVSLFRTVTLEDWTDLMYIQMYGCNAYGYDGMRQLCSAPAASPLGGALFFISFVLFGTMIVLNLFIGVILSGMDEAHAEAAAELLRAGRTEAESTREVSEQIGEVMAELAVLQRRLGQLQKSSRGLVADEVSAEMSGCGVDVSERTPAAATPLRQA